VSGYAMVLGDCFACKRPFMFNPTHVPSVLIDPANGLPPDMGGDPGRARREPLCEACVTRANVARMDGGKAPINVHPEAYEPAREDELDWSDRP
jgi:hypothetical protein